jgi:hypothetical protein
MKFWVVKCGDLYMRFGSYRQAELVESPFAATPYRRKLDADRRATEAAHIIGKHKGTSAALHARKVVEIEPTIWYEDGIVKS